MLTVDIQAAYRCHVNPHHAELAPRDIGRVRNGIDTNNRYADGKDTTGMS
jgi:hypothetical protein